jgi:hypothetical protein
MVFKIQNSRHKLTRTKTTDTLWYLVKSPGFVSSCHYPESDADFRINRLFPVEWSTYRYNNTLHRQPIPHRLVPVPISGNRNCIVWENLGYKFHHIAASDSNVTCKRKGNMNVPSIRFLVTNSKA